MITTIRQWLTTKWRLLFSQEDMVKAYAMTFASAPGQMVLNHLVDNVYCTICESTDPIMLAMHNGRRALVHEILLNIDMGQNRSKYVVRAMVETQPSQDSNQGVYGHA